MTAIRLKLSYEGLLALERILDNSMCELATCVNNSQKIIWWILTQLKQRLNNHTRYRHINKKTFQLNVLECYALHLWLKSVHTDNVYEQVLRDEIFGILDRKII